MITHADETLNRYLADIRKAPDPDPGEEKALIAMAARGSREARDRLVKMHMRFVVKVALHFRNTPMPVPDLISEGSFGLIKAVETYDPSRGVKFISYAVWWIRSYIVQALQNKAALIRLPANQQLRISRAARESRGCALAADILGMMELQRPGRIDATGNVDGAERADAPGFGPERELQARRLETKLGRAISDLPPQEAYVLRNIYGIRQEQAVTLKEIAGELGLSVERVRQIKLKALQRLQRQRTCVELMEGLPE